MTGPGIAESLQGSWASIGRCADGRGLLRVVLRPNAP
jgi:hypothetical protein